MNYEHPDIIDRFGRVWVWKIDDLYTHDEILCWPRSCIIDNNIELPRPKLADNPNYPCLCAICKSEWWS